MIPKIIHQIWIQGYDNLPQKFKNKQEILKKYNPEYQIITWDDTSIRKLLQKHTQILNLYANIELLDGFIKIYQSQSDIARLVILKEYGGFYIDIDYYCPISLDDIHQKNDTLIVINSEYDILKYFPFFYHPKYGASFIGVIKNHELFDGLFTELVNQTNRDIIGTLFDRYLQKTKFDVKFIDSNYVSSHTSCDCSLCYTPKSSSSFYGRDILIYINCNKKLIIMLILIIFIFYFVTKT